MIYNNIKYHKIDEIHESNSILTNDLNALREDVVLKKHIYDYFTTDSKVEREFASSLESNASVIVYAKLPRAFKITTPIESYFPDWAIVLVYHNFYNQLNGIESWKKYSLEEMVNLSRVVFTLEKEISILKK